MKTRQGRTVWRSLLLAAVTAAFLVALASPVAAKSARTGRWVSGDIHNHTYLTDGKQPFGEVVRQGFSVYGLDFLANSEHGGTSAYNPAGVPFVTPVWRWITLSNYSYPLIQDARQVYPERTVIQGVEWNAPTHEHVSVGIVGPENEPGAVSAFEYRFDAADTDTSRAGESTKVVKDSATGEILIPAMPFSKINATQSDMLAGVDWLEQAYGDQAYAIVNHPSRKNLWHVGDFRAMNDVAPDVCFGFEGLPGHQAAPARGEYGNHIKADGSVTSDKTLADPTLTSHARTYGGADWMTATVGGLWDALLGEGRRWWIVDNSDFHLVNTAYKDAAGTTIGLDYADFWPGQYAKTWVYVNKFTPEGVVRGMRSGRVFVANGDLVGQLKFTASAGKHNATMGGVLNTTPGSGVVVTIAVRSPRVNNNGDPVRLNHIDLIAGQVTGRIGPTTADGAANPAYTQSDTNPTTKVIKTFTRSNWKVEKGWKVMTARIKVAGSTYFRLRGTNIPPNTANQSDAAGNPLMDELDYVQYPNPKDGGVKPDGTPDVLVGNTPDAAFADLWFYSNPVFVFTAAQ